MSEFGPKPDNYSIKDQIEEMINNNEYDISKADLLINSNHDQIALGDILLILEKKRDALRPPPSLDNSNIDQNNTHAYLLQQRFLLGLTMVATKRITELSGKHENPGISN
jgi:hypothetical protein